MIRLMDDHIFMGIQGAEVIPCSAEQITLELAESAIGHLPTETLHQATLAVLHYFKEDLGQLQVTPEDFSNALVRVLEGLGIEVEITEILSETGEEMELSGKLEEKAAAEETEGREESLLVDLRSLACEAGKLGELAFFPRLRGMLLQGLEQGGAQLVEFRELRGAVKQLLGRKHWCPSCQVLQEQIVESLRTWWADEQRSRGKALVVR